MGITATLPGPNILYQGQEIGMINTPWASIDDHRDIVDYVAYQNAGDQMTNKIINGSRDNARTPMQ
jgi:glycosidase